MYLADIFLSTVYDTKNIYLMWNKNLVGVKIKKIKFASPIAFFSQAIFIQCEIVI